MVSNVLYLLYLVNAGSPNISGRETPQSMGDGAVGGAANPANLPVTVPKPNNDLTDR